MRIVFGLSGGIKKYFLLLSIMAENKRISKKFFPKCVAASRARIELDAVALWNSWLSGLIFLVKKSIKMRGNMNIYQIK